MEGPRSGRGKAPDLDAQLDGQLRKQGERFEVLWEADGQLWQLREEVAQANVAFGWERMK